MTISEAARMSGMSYADFLHAVRSGSVEAERRGNTVTMSDSEAYRLVTRKNPMLSFGRGKWMSCGRHTFMAVSEEVPCPVFMCGGRVREAKPREVLGGGGERPSEYVRECVRCGAQIITKNKWKRKCELCEGSRTRCNGKASQSSWNGVMHACCGSRVNWRHKDGCSNTIETGR